MSSDREIPVHPNSMAARKWGRTTWRTSRNLYAEAAELRRIGKAVEADALIRKAARSNATEHRCG